MAPRGYMVMLLVGFVIAHLSSSCLAMTRAERKEYKYGLLFYLFYM